MLSGSALLEKAKRQVEAKWLTGICHVAGSGRRKHYDVVAITVALAWGTSRGVSLRCVQNLATHSKTARQVEQ